MTVPTIAAVAALACVVAAGSGIAMPAYIAAARRHGLMDRPTARSAHSAQTPRGAGIVLVFVFTLVSASYFAWTHAPREAWTILLGTLLVALVGFAEDSLGLGISLRLVLVAACGAVLSPWWASTPLAASGSVLALVYLVNMANFMDGVNGMATGLALSSCAGFIGLALTVHDTWTAVGAALFAAAYLGFAPYNVPSAQAFLGDAGSYAVGAFMFFESSRLLTAGVRPLALLLVLVVPAFDVSVTLTARALRGEDVRIAHSKHLYQRLFRSVGQHWPVSAFALGLGLIASVVAVFAQHVEGPFGDGISVACGAGVVAVYVATLRRSEGWTNRAPGSGLHG